MNAHHDAYETAERAYLEALAAGALPSDLAALSRALRDTADTWQTTAWREYFDARDQGREPDGMLSNMNVEAEKAEMLHELWGDIASAHETAAGSSAAPQESRSRLTRG